MKKIVCFAAMAAFGVLFIEGCTKQEGIATEVDGFSISVSTPGTKTVFDGDAYTVEWEEDDALGVVIDDGSEAELYKFTKSSGNTFTCADFVPVEGASYTYYVNQNSEKVNLEYKKLLFLEDIMYNIDIFKLARREYND